MKSSLLILFPLMLMSCGTDPEVADVPKVDSPAIPDSVPHSIVMGDITDEWPYKPDTAVNALVLGNNSIWKKWTPDNGNQGRKDGSRKEMEYTNIPENQLLTVFTYTNDSWKEIPYGFRIIRFAKDSTQLYHDLNYTNERSFITGHGIYIGEPFSYVQSVYRSQPMMTWIKGDTTYLAYAPQDKDQSQYTRYSHVNYSAQYKFVNDQCVVIEMMVDPEEFETTK